MTNMLEEFDYCLAGIAWNAWRELGVRGVDRLYVHYLIQPEELVILTSIIAAYDPRLRDEALDWCSRYHDFISVSRLRALLKEMGAGIEQLFSQFAVTVNSVSSAKWPVMHDVNGFKVQLSGKSELPALDSPSLLMFRLRNLFGPGVKADVLTHFLTRNGVNFSASDLVEIGYSKRSLMIALDHLAASGLVSATNVRNKKNYELKKPRELQVIIGKLPVIAPPWTKIVKAIVTIRSAISKIEKNLESTRGIILRNCLVDIESLLPYFISPILQGAPNFRRDWDALLQIFRSFQQGNFYMQYQVYDEFDKTVSHFLQYLYRVDDCVDGIDMIEDKVRFKYARHKDVYKECYQLFLSFISDLAICLPQFLALPFHKMMDESLADLPYQFSKDKFFQLSAKMKQVQPIDAITTAQLAIQQYQLFMPELNDLRQFIYTFRKQLEDLYFMRTDVHLLSLSNVLYKGHLVLDLFKNDREE